MPWTEITRPQYSREGMRYPSDMTDAEWALIAPFMPAPNRLGRPRTTYLRAVVEAILYMASTGCQWRQLPKEFPPYSTVQDYFYPWSRDGTWARINHALAMAAREAASTTSSPGRIAGRHGRHPGPGRHRRDRSHRYGAFIPGCATSSPTAPMPATS